MGQIVSKMKERQKKMMPLPQITQLVRIGTQSKKLTNSRTAKSMTKSLSQKFVSFGNRKWDEMQMKQ